MNQLRIGIAGCGIAGLASALVLARAGHQVTLFERFAEPQPIGSGLMIQPTGLAVLRELGLVDPIVGEGARIDRLHGRVGERIVLDVRYAALGGSTSAFGIGIHRSSLFAALFDAVRDAGIAIETGREICGSTETCEGRSLSFADGTTSESFDLVIDALGTRSPLAPVTGRELRYGALWASLDWPEGGQFSGDALEQRYHRASVMAGVLPIGQPRGAERRKAAFFWSLRADRLNAWQVAGLARWKHEVLELWPACAPLLDQIVTPDQLTFARYAHRTLRVPAESRLLHLGDAWHSASPQLGQGANMALLDAWALGRGLDGAANLREGLDRVVALRRRHILTYQALTAIFTPVYQSDSRFIPWLRDRLVGPLSRIWPATWIQAAMVSGLIGNPLRPLELEAP